MQKNLLKLKKGKKKKISAKLICKKKPKTHISKFRYESSNAKIVTVNKKGKIKALKKENVIYMCMRRMVSSRK